MRVFFDNLTVADIKKIFNKCKDNSQTLPPWGGLVNFLKEVKNVNPGLLDNEILEFISKYA